MKPVIMNMSEMSDSREVYESKPGRAGILFLYVFLLLVVVALLWMVFGKVDEVVKSEGIIRPKSDISTVTNQTEGQIIMVYVEDGDEVHKGDSLYQVDCSVQEKKRDYIEQQKKETVKKKKCLEAYKRSIKAGTNLLKQDGEEEEYYAKFEAYFLAYQDAVHMAKYNKKQNHLQIETTKKQLLVKEKEIAYYQRLLDSVRKKKNMFDNSGEEESYSVMYQKYMNGYQKMNQQYGQKNQEINAQTTQEGFVNTITYYTTQKEGIEALIQSIKEGKDCFGSKSSYQMQYEQYEQKMEQLQQEYQTALDDYNLNFELEEYGISEQELAQSEVKMDRAKQAISDYRSSCLAELSKQLTEVKKEIADAKTQKNGLVSKKVLLKNNEKQRKQELSYYVNNYKDEINQIIADKEDLVHTLRENLQSLELEKEKPYQYSENEDSNAGELRIAEFKTTIESIINCEDQIKELDSQLDTIQLQIDEATVTASIDGIVNSNMELVCGDVLAAGVPVMTILPKEGSAYKVVIYVANRNIGNIEEGMKVKLSLDALPSAEYGYLDGMVSRISQDSRMDEGNLYGYYLVEAEVKNRRMYGKDGKEVVLKPGMSGQAKMIVGEKSIFRYVMEKLDLWVER